VRAQNVESAAAVVVQHIGTKQIVVAEDIDAA
jgi:hypothetical protein